MNIEQKTITSVEVAEMVSKDHKNILRDVRGYTEELGELKIEPSDFFQEGTYINGQNKELPCYLVTKKGCEFIGNKLTGIKGTEFTAKYINRFHDMEEVIKKPKSSLEILELELQAIKEIDSKVESVNKDLQEFKQDMPILALESERIIKAKNRKVVPLLGGKGSLAYKNRSLTKRVYKDLEAQLNREFGTDTYKAIKRNQTDHAIEIINSYQLPMALKEEIEDTNSQITLPPQN